MVDLEWGLSPSEQERGAIDSEFRAKELQRCHDISVGPSFFVSFKTNLQFEPRCEKTGLRGLRPGPTQTRLYS